MIQRITIYLNGRRTTYYPPNLLVNSLLPKGRGEAQQRINEAIAQVFNADFDTLATVAEKYATTPSAIITFALTYQAGAVKRLPFYSDYRVREG